MTTASDSQIGDSDSQIGNTLEEELSCAMWEGDLDKLNALAGCGCCCAEHFFEDCPARSWGGCRGQHSLTRADYAAWEEHYRKHHGLSHDQFYGAEAAP